MVTGHVDSTGRIKRIVTEGDAILYQISLQKEIISRLIDRGSIAIDGISLTIQALNQEDIIVSIIPHTTSNTTLQSRKVGDVLNIETDVIGKYVDRLLNAGKKNTNVNMSFLSECGFV
jgi:riboflavin synthase